jgi:hypothetical protein
MKEQFIERRFSSASAELIAKANEIISEYILLGFVLTLRQLYYQMVARDILANKTRTYKRLGEIVNDARLAGLIDWAALEDRTRNLTGSDHWDSPGSIIQSAADSFALDKWEGQPYRPELWVEKQALENIVQRAASDNDLHYLSCRGYMSASEMYEAAQRIKRRRDLDGQETVIIYCGDHDPSGLDMSENDIPKRFEVFLNKYGQDRVLINRVALNFDQVEQYQPPPNPAKKTDSRFKAYRKRFGTESWELDSLEPTMLLSIIQTAIDELKDPALYDGIKEREEAEREVLSKASERWDDVARFLEEEEA